MYRIVQHHLIVVLMHLSGLEVNEPEEIYFVAGFLFPLYYKCRKSKRKKDILSALLIKQTLTS